MLFTLQDVAGLLLAMALAVPVLVLPGALVAQGADLLGFRDDRAVATAPMVATLAGLGFRFRSLRASLPAFLASMRRLSVLALLAVGGGSW